MGAASGNGLGTQSVGNMLNGGKFKYDPTLGTSWDAQHALWLSGASPEERMTSAATEASNARKTKESEDAYASRRYDAAKASTAANNDPLSAGLQNLMVYRAMLAAQEDPTKKYKTGTQGPVSGASTALSSNAGLPSLKGY